jgi:hypothetical protein
MASAHGEHRTGDPADAGRLTPRRFIGLDGGGPL